MLEPLPCFRSPAGGWRFFTMTLPVLGVLLLGPKVARPGSLQLVTPEEAALRDAKTWTMLEGERSRPGTDTRRMLSSENEGPQIEIKRPDLAKKEYKSPIEIDILFHRRRAAIALTTLKVSYLKWISVDITKRVRPYVSTGGIHIPAANLPAGKHRIRISIADVEGRRSKVTVVFRIAD